MKIKTYDTFRKEANKYKKILLEYKNNGTVFTDPNFHPSEQIIESKSCFEGNDIEWVRINSISSSPLFQKDLISPDFIRMGEINNSHFLTAILRASRQPENIPKFFNKITSNQVFGKVKDTINIDCGAVVVYFHCYGQKTPVLIDTLLPMKNGKLIFSNLIDDKKSPWFLLVEKAYAKLNGSYSNIEYCTFSRSVFNLCGYFPETKFSFDFKEKVPLFEKLLKYQKQKAIMGASIVLNQNKNNVNEKELDEKGLVNNFCYSLEKLKKIEGKRFVCLRNPRGTNEWKGDWCNDSPLWTNELKDELDLKEENNGVFWMNDDDFFRYFSEVEVSKPIPKDWHSRQFFVQLTPGDHDGYPVENSRADISNKPNFAFQIIEQIPEGEKCQFYIIVEKHHKTVDEENVDKLQYCIFLAHSGGKKLDSNQLSSIKQYQFITCSDISSTKYDVESNDDIVTIVINRLQKSDLIEDCYVNIYCEKDFKLYNIDNPDELIDEVNNKNQKNDEAKISKQKDTDDNIKSEEIEKLKEELELKNKIILKSKKENKKLKNLLDKEMQEKEQALASYQLLKESSEKQKEEISQENKNDKYINQISELKTELEKEKSLQKSMKKEQQKKDLLIYKKDKQIEKSQNEINELKNQMEKEKDDLISLNNQKQKEIDELKDQMNKIEKEKNDLISINDQKQKEIDQLKQEIENLKRQIPQPPSNNNNSQSIRSLSSTKQTKSKMDVISDIYLSQQQINKPKMPSQSKNDVLNKSKKQKQKMKEQSASVASVDSDAERLFSDDSQEMSNDDDISDSESDEITNSDFNEKKRDSTLINTLPPSIVKPSNSKSRPKVKSLKSKNDI